MLCATGHSWSETPLAEPQETPPAPTLEQECGLKSHRVFGGQLIGLESGPGFSGFVRELDGTLYGHYYAPWLTSHFSLSRTPRLLTGK